MEKKHFKRVGSDRCWRWGRRSNIKIIGVSEEKNPYFQKTLIFKRFETIFFKCTIIPKIIDPKLPTPRHKWQQVTLKKGKILWVGKNSKWHVRKKKMIITLSTIILYTWRKWSNLLKILKGKCKQRLLCSTKSTFNYKGHKLIHRTRIWKILLTKLFLRNQKITEIEKQHHKDWWWPSNIVTCTIKNLGAKGQSMICNGCMYRWHR